MSLEQPEDALITDKATERGLSCRCDYASMMAYEAVKIRKALGIIDG